MGRRLEPREAAVGSMKRKARYLLLGIAMLGAALAPRSCGPRLWLPEYIGFPFGWVDAFPHMTRLDTPRPPSYSRILEAMDSAWDDFEIGPQFAPDWMDPSWRWVRLPNGHVLRACPWRLGANLAIGALCGYAIGSVVRMLRKRPWFVCKCGYDLTGNVSGRCPECGLPVNREVR